MGNTDMTVEMKPASYPVVVMQSDGMDINTLFGYSNQMNASYLRYTLTPLPENRKIYIKIKLFDNEISGLTYEVRSLDTSRLVEKTDVYDYIHMEDEISADLSIKDLIEKDQEYILVITLHMSSGEEVNYYTRIVQNDNLHVQDEIKFISEFHEKSFDKAEAKSLVTYLESNEDGDNSTYQYVNIHSNFQQVTWGKLQIINKYNLQTQILEMDPQTASFLLKYNIDIKNNKETETYYVKEFYRIRYTEERIYLLDYERTMNQLFSPDLDVFANDKIILGITKEDNQFYETADGSIILFEQANSLFEYRNNEGKLAKIFSYYDENNFDIRTLNDDNIIKVLNLDEAGNVTFMVAGYMNRGSHEGKVGISVYYYNNSMNSIEEKIYIPYRKSAKLLLQDLDKLAYINRNNELYLYLEGGIYCVHVDEKSSQKIADNVNKSGIVASEGNEMVAWQNNASTISLRNLGRNKTREITAEYGGMIHALGFVGNDFVYGISSPSDVVKDETGVVITPMKTIIIEDEDGKELKRYDHDNIFVTDVSIKDATIDMSRIKKNADGGGYQIIESDQIINNVAEESTKNRVGYVITEEKETIAEITLMNNVTSSIHLQTPKEVLTEGMVELNVLDDESDTNQYYVYAKGEIYGIFEKPNTAVNNAYAANGVVVDNSQEYIWQRGNRQQRVEMSRISPKGVEDGNTLSACLDTLLEYEGTPRNSFYLLQHGETALSLLKDNIDGKVLDLTGCELQTVLYYVSQQTPVLATVEDGKSILIVGYDEKNTIIFDPSTSSIYKKGMNDSTEWFADSGNEFIAYVRSK